MERPFKFRICYTDQNGKKSIIYSDNNRFLIGLNGKVYENYGKDWKDPMWEEVFDSYEPPIIQQYTGLKDKNGKEIYEGDLVNTIYEHDPYNCIGKVIYHDETASYRIKTYKNLLPIVTFRFIEDKPQGLLNVVSEVIGNEFEKPPCNFDHNAECLVCNGWPSDCPFAKFK